MRPDTRRVSDGRCESCGRALPLLRGILRATCKRRSCPSYAPTWGRDSYMRLLLNVLSYGGRVSFVSLTAPGREGLPHDGEPGDWQVRPDAADAWNLRHWAEWSRLHRAAKARADRKLGFRGKLVGYSRELQGRGVWHLHIALGMQTGHERAWAIEYGRALRELSPRYLFGFVDLKPLREAREGAGAAGYMAKYLTKGTGEELAAMLALAPGRPLLYVSPALTSLTGVTMRSLRLVRRAYRAALDPLGQHFPLSDEDRAVLSRCMLTRLEFARPPPAALGPASV